MKVFALISAIHRLFDLLILLIIIRSFLTFVPTSSNNSLVRFIFKVTEPVLLPFRILISDFMPRSSGYYVDFSPLIAILVINLFRSVITRLILIIIR